jgi:hypothetical protein
MAGPVGDVLVDVNCDDLAGRTDELGQQRGVVPAGADLQDPHPDSDLRLFQHVRVEVQRGHRAERAPVLVPLGDHAGVGVVDLFQVHARSERLPGDLAHRCLDRRRDDRALGDEVVDDLVTQLSSAIRASGLFIRGRVSHRAFLIVVHFDGAGEGGAHRKVVWYFAGPYRSGHPLTRNRE